MYVQRSVGTTLLLAALAGSVPALERTAAQQPAGLRPVADFAGVADRHARALALFAEAGKVLQHPRCVNCHPAADSPHQTDRGRLHQPVVVRGADGHGAPTLQCNTCHGSANFDPAHVPGHPEWHLAPVSMAWEGRSLGEICAQIKDRARNGDRDLATLLHHVSVAGHGRRARAARRRRDRRPSSAASCEHGSMPAPTARRHDPSGRPVPRCSVARACRHSAE